MRQKDKRICLDVTVKRGAECNTDHQLLCASVCLVWHNCGQTRKKQSKSRYDASKLMKCDDHERNDGQQALSECYIDSVVESARNGWVE